MAFNPLNQNNAILEAVVLIGFSRPIFDFEAEAVRALHKQLEADLPKLEPVPTGMVFVGQMPLGLVAGQPPSAPVGPVQMGAYRRDATVETRLLLNGNVLAFNFLSYTRWSEIRSKAIEWSSVCLGALVGAKRDGIPPLQINTISHQMIDVFKWEGSAGAISTTDLLVDGTSRVARAAQEAKGNSWFSAHSCVTQGFADDAPASSLLDFISFDLSEEQNFGWRMRIEHTLEARFLPSSLPLEVFTPGWGVALLDKLHSKNQDLIRNTIQPAMLARIGMGMSSGRT